MYADASASIEEIMRIYDSLRAEFAAIAELLRKLNTPAVINGGNDIPTPITKRAIEGALLPPADFLL
jgi:hypothetical protein